MNLDIPVSPLCQGGNPFRRYLSDVSGLALPFYTECNYCCRRALQTKVLNVMLRLLIVHLRCNVSNISIINNNVMKALSPVPRANPDWNLLLLMVTFHN